LKTALLSEDEIAKGLVESIKQRNVFPLFCVSAKLNYGVDKLLILLYLHCLLPTKLLLPKQKKEKKYHVIRQAPYLHLFLKLPLNLILEKCRFYKVCSGTITESMDVINSFNGSKERASQFLSLPENNVKKLKKLLPEILVQQSN
jgi:elongation factor G